MHNQVSATSDRASPAGTVSYSELARHHTYDDAWISIHGRVYDITDYIDLHPFGDTFRANLGTECGGIFSSSHLNTNVEKHLQSDRFLQRSGIIFIGYLDASDDDLHPDNGTPYLNRIIYKDLSQDAFWIDLKTQVKRALDQRGESVHYRPSEAIAYILYYATIYLGLSYLTWVYASFSAALLLGFHMLCAVANISHMATHFGFSRSRWVDFIAEQFFDLGGMSWLEWQIEHQSHHSQPHSPIDQQTNQYDQTLATRIHRYTQRKGHHRYQRLYFWLAVSPYLLLRAVTTSLWMIRNREFVRHWYEAAGHIVARALFIGPVIYCAAIHGPWTAIGLFLLYALAYSHSAFILLYNDHEATHEFLGKDPSVAAHHYQISWPEAQVRTSSNWYPTNWILRFIEFHYGYFNYHIEHHLFPAFKPRLLKRISPIVRRVCEKHGVPYVSTTFAQVQRSLYEHLVKLGSPDPPRRAAARRAYDPRDPRDPRGPRGPRGRRRSSQQDPAISPEEAE